MINYAQIWKQYVNFNQIQFDDFLNNYDMSNYYLSLKYDGQLGSNLYINSDNYFQSTSSDKKLLLPLNNDINEFKLKYFKSINNIVFIGELVGIKNGKILSFNETESIIKTLHDPRKEFINFFIYDIYEINNKKISFEQSLNLIKTLKEYKRIHFINHLKGNIENFNILQDIIHKTGKTYEGIVARDINTGKGIKIKRFLSFDTVLIGIGNINMKSWKKEQISYLIPAFLSKNNTFITTSKIGTGFNFNEKSFFFNLAKKTKLQETSNGNILIKPTLIIEIEFQEFNLKLMDEYKYDKTKYLYLGKTNSCTLRNPRYLRLRPDKKINYQDIGIDNQLK